MKASATPIVRSSPSRSRVRPGEQKPPSELPPTAGTQAISVDDEGLLNGNLGDGTSSGDFDVVPDPEHIANGTLIHDFEDGTPAVANPINFSPMHGTTGTVGTEAVAYSWDPATNTLTASSGRGDIFKVVVDGGVDGNPQGSYTFTLLKPVLHALGDGENDASFALTYEVINDEDEAATGTLNVTVDDDTPIVLAELCVNSGRRRRAEWSPCR